MSPAIRLLAIGFLVSAASLLAPAAGRSEPPEVVSEETREFDILVSGKPTGKSTIRIKELDDGATVVTNDVEVKFDFVVYVYDYQLHGKETWQGDQLTLVENRGSNNGTKFKIRAQVDADGSTIKLADKAAAKGPALEMTTNFWRCPTPLETARSFLDVDKGTVLSSKLKQVGTETILVAGHKLKCARYRLEGALAADLWFDEQSRLVKQQTVEMGFATEIRLRKLTQSDSPLATR